MIDVALVTAHAAIDLDEDLAPLLQACGAAGLRAEAWPWDDASRDWSQCRLALLRSPWDYTERQAEFLRWLAQTEAQTRVLNPPALLRWNIDKRYLADLQAAGVAIVPTRFLAVGDALPQDLPQEFVLKPAVGAGSKGALRLRGDEVERARAHLAALHAAGQVALLQPYLARVDSRGEAALICFDGQWSHAITKGPLLKPAQGLVQGLFAAEQITPCQPTDAQLQAAHRVLQALRGIPASGGQDPLYARVDLLEGEDGSPLLLELELAEPSLFFAHAPGAAERLVRGILGRLG